MKRKEAKRAHVWGQRVFMILHQLGLLYQEGVDRGMQIRRSVLFFGPIRRSHIIFVQFRIRIS